MAKANEKNGNRGGSKVKIGVVGTGAVGGYFGACLSRGGNEVVFHARGANLAKLKSDGLVVESAQGDFTATGVFTDCYDEMADADLVLFCVKATASEAVARQLAPVLKHDALVLTLQNGVDNEEILASFFGKGRILSAASYIQAQLREPGMVKQIGIPPRLVIGALDLERKEEVLKTASLLNTAGVETYSSENIMLVKWKKLLWNVTFNPLSAVIESKVGTILDDAGLRRTAERICQEAIAVARRAGVPLEEDAWEEIMAQGEIGRNHETSMLQDKRKGKQMEIESICGYIVRKGIELDVETPVLETVYSVLKEMERTPGEMVEMN
jgi:2-dehydropantoate 2-reductase